ncbi:DUF721 domain-containing protein [Thermomonas sp. S9]|uniref:DUF721 domain-containing protein n=1 Tax=Thermomonas sp. S9 TaxID=2885203 RepID=UPI00216AEF69|nr:DUF721 domain-containing protein [Thermomonas sp. S9]MCR6497351.1 DUF721 domain-containing protein [Thermomonas sp. S9]
MRRAQWLAAVDQLLRPHLPAGLAAHARLANVRGRRLVFLVDAPAWHARLRLASPGLIDAARSLGLEVEAVGIKVAAQPLDPPAAPRPAAGRWPFAGPAGGIGAAALRCGRRAGAALSRARRRDPRSAAARGHPSGTSR